MNKDTLASQQAALQYYRITDQAYRALCPEQSSHMNLGFWPAKSIEAAQRAVVERTLQTLKAAEPNPLCVVEGGPGWGGARPVVAEVFSKAAYIGVNCSERQIKSAQQFNAAIPNTQYKMGFLENMDQMQWPNGPLSFFAVEAVIHVEDKAAFFKKLAATGFDNICIAEICLEKKEKVLKNPLFDPSLTYTWPSDRYRPAFQEAGYGQFAAIDVTEAVFKGWSEWLQSHIQAEQFSANKRVLSHFRQSYQALAEHAAAQEVTYKIFSATRVKEKPLLD